MPAWLEALTALDRSGEAGVLVSVIAARGSAPREAGAKMVVSATGSWDTIGGGNLEYQSIREARALLARESAAPLQRDFPLGPSLGQCCGGATTILFEPIRPPSWTVALFGAGHVGRAIARLLGDLPCRLLWFDARPDIFPDLIAPNTRLRPSAEPADVAALPPGTTVLIMTHDHGTDFVLADAALLRPELPFIGVIGSQTKRARFLSRLRQAGHDPAVLERLHCPIGLPGVGTKLPAEIAIAVAAQLLLTRQAPVAVQGTGPAQRGKPEMTVIERPGLMIDSAERLRVAAGCGAAGCDAACDGSSSRATTPLAHTATSAG